MPRARRLEKLSAGELAKIPQFARPKKYRATLPARIESTADAVRRKLDDWAKSLPAPTAATPTEMRVNAVKFTVDDLTKLRKIRESKYATAEIINQKLGPADLLGLIFSAMTVNAFCNMKKEYERRLRAARSRYAKRQAAQQWRQIVNALSAAFRKGGIGGLGERDLHSLSVELKKSRANFRIVQAFANTGVTREYDTYLRRNVLGQLMASAKLLPLHAIAITLPDTTPDLCEEPIEGSYTGHISSSFSLRVCLDVPCPTLSKPWRWCNRCFTVAGASFSINVNIGYKIDCHGMSTWGCGSVEACVTPPLGPEVCADCSSCVSGVAGVAQSASSTGMCTYGHGLELRTTCRLAGVTVFSTSVPLGLTVEAPCPPS